MTDNSENDALPSEYKQQNQNPLRQVDVGDFINAPPTNEDVLQDDLRDLLDVLGMPSGAQPRSPHEVFRDALMRMKLIRNAALEEAAKVAEECVYPSNWAVAARIRALKELP